MLKLVVLKDCNRLLPASGSFYIDENLPDLSRIPDFLFARHMAFTFSLTFHTYRTIYTTDNCRRDILSKIFARFLFCQAILIYVLK